MATTKFSFEEYKKRLNDIEIEYKRSCEKLEKLNEERYNEQIKLTDDFLQLEGKFLKLSKHTYFFVRYASVRPYSRMRDTSIEITGIYFYIDDGPYIDETSARWDSNKCLTFNISDLKNYEEITKDEFCQAFDICLSKLRELNEQTIKTYIKRLENDKE